MLTADSVSHFMSHSSARPAERPIHGGDSSRYATSRQLPRNEDSTIITMYRANKRRRNDELYEEHIAHGVKYE